MPSAQRTYKRTTSEEDGEPNNDSSESLSEKGLNGCAICFLGCFIFIVVLIIHSINGYFNDVEDEREIIDTQEVHPIHESKLNYTTNKLVNCSNDVPCRGLSCENVKKHFLFTPHECEYHDWSDFWSTFLIIVGCFFGGIASCTIIGLMLAAFCSPKGPCSRRSGSTQTHTTTSA